MRPAEQVVTPVSACAFKQAKTADQPDAQRSKRDRSAAKQPEVQQKSKWTTRMSTGSSNLKQWVPGFVTIFLWALMPETMFIQQGLPNLIDRVMEKSVTKRKGTPPTSQLVFPSSQSPDPQLCDANHAVCRTHNRRQAAIAKTIAPLVPAHGQNLVHPKETT